VMEHFGLKPRGGESYFSNNKNGSGKSQRKSRYNGEKGWGVVLSSMKGIDHPPEEMEMLT